MKGTVVIGEAGHDDESFEFHAELDGCVVFLLDDLFGAYRASARKSDRNSKARPFEIAASMWAALASDGPARGRRPHQRHADIAGLPWTTLSPSAGRRAHIASAGKRWKAGGLRRA